MTAFKDKQGKPSPKRIFGAVEVTIGLLMAICSGFDFYNIDTGLILTILGNGGFLLGIGTFEKR